MVRNRARIFAGVLCLAAGMVVGPSDPAQAQSPSLPVSGEKAIEVPSAVLASTLSGVVGIAVIDRFLRGDGASSTLVARRAAAIIRQLGALRDRIEPGELLGAVDRVVHVSARSLSYASVMRLAVAENYRPQSAVLAWDFGPAAGKTMPGFERILPNDKRIFGNDITGHLLAQRNSLLTDGVSGLRKIELDLADGNYRIILMTQNLGDTALAKLPFGREVRINGMPLIVNSEGPANWLDYALLGNSAVRLASGAFDRAGGFLTGGLDDEAGSLYGAQQGGAIILEGATLNGKLVIELSNFGSARSYVTGLIVEPPETVSDLILSRTAINNVIPLDVRIALESEILLVAAETVQGIAPAAGQAFESDTVVTAN